MAFAAVVSVEQILQQLLHSDDLLCTKSEIESFHLKIRSLQSSLENIYPVRRSIRDIVNELESEVRNKVYEAQDLIEAFISGQISPSVFLQNLKDNAEKLNPIAATAKEIADSMKEKLEASESPSRARRSLKIVGQDEDFKKLRYGILIETPDCQTIPITGLPGIGKTTLARSVFEDKEIVDRFTIRSWVTVGQEYIDREILLKILASIESKGQKSHCSESTNHGNNEQLADNLYKCLLNKRYLIVVDDVWDITIWNRIKNYFPDNKNCSRIVVTTRIDNIAGNIKSDFFHKMEPLNKEISWNLLREKVFGGRQCPPNLLTIGKNIAEHCGGLPLSITVVGGQLSQQMDTKEYWEIVEEDTKAASESERETYLEILSRSYEHLPGRLKGCFLYMGAFPEDSEITVSKLVKLWVAEGFLIQTQPLSLEQVAHQCLIDLVDRNLVSPLKFSSNGRITTCGMHDSIRHLAETQSEEEKFFVSLKKFPSQRNQFRGETADPLRGLDALAIHLIEFPSELVGLIHLRYLSLTYNGRLPASLSQLKNLVVLIVRRYPKIIVMRRSILPVEIWYMKQLRHILLTECDFPDIPEIHEGNSPLLENLQSLSNINAVCCNEEFFKNMPNLKKLRIWIEAPGPVNMYLDHLPDLEAFKFTVLNPIPGKEIELQRSLVFPEKLEKLSLSGCGLPWDCMANFGNFPCLQVLKLRQFAFQGPKCIPEKKQFPELKFLLLECLDLEELCLDYSCCGKLENLIIRNCYELKKIDRKLERMGSLKEVEFVGCNYAAVKCVEKVREELMDYDIDLSLRVYSSWEEESSNDC